MNDTLYQEELLEHFKYPKYRKKITNPDFAAGDYNPSCGDRLAIEGKVVDGIIVDIGFTGSGCVISQAAASMLTEMCVGKTLDAILALTKDDITAMIAIQLGPTRLKCALLCLHVLHEGVGLYQKKQ